MSSHSISTFGAQIFFIFPQKFAKKISDQILPIFFCTTLVFRWPSNLGWTSSRVEKTFGFFGLQFIFFIFFIFFVSREWHRLELVEKGHLPVWGPSMSANLVEAGYMTEAQKSRVADIGQNVFVSYLVVDNLRSPTASN